MEKPEKFAPKATRAREKVELPTPTLRSDAESVAIFTELLSKAPDLPEFTSMNEVTAWLDKTYRPWLNQVRHELPK